MPRRVTPEQLRVMQEGKELYAFFDVRERYEYEKEQIPGATLISRHNLEKRIAELLDNKDIKIILYSEKDNRSGLVANLLEEAGYTQVSILEGGLSGWKQAGLPTVRGIHVASKVFGEFVGVVKQEVDFVQPDQLNQWIKDDPEGQIVVEIRPRNEVEETGSIPGAINIPGVELPRKLLDLKRRNKKIILTCAGRTRGIIATSTVGRLDLGKVYNLEHGTLGWRLAGYELEQNIPLGERASDESKEFALEHALELAEREALEFISPRDLENRLKQRREKPFLLYDVRQAEQFLQDGHIAGAGCFPGGQAVQNSDDAVWLHNSEIVFVCSDSTRSIIVAYWYKRMGFHKVKILQGGMEAWKKEGLPVEYEKPSSPEPLLLESRVGKVKRISAKEYVENYQKKSVLIDVGDGRNYVKGHLAGAKWLTRSNLERDAVRMLSDKQERIVVSAADKTEAIYAAFVLGRLGYVRVAVLDEDRSNWQLDHLEVVSGSDGYEIYDWQVTLSEYNLEEAKNYFEWEANLTNPPYSDHLKKFI